MGQCSCPAGHEPRVRPRGRGRLRVLFSGCWIGSLEAGVSPRHTYIPDSVVLSPCRVQPHTLKITSSFSHVDQKALISCSK